MQKLIRFTLAAIISISATACGGSDSAAVPIPELTAWKENMLHYGAIHCKEFQNKSLSEDQLLAMTYYDAEWVYFQIADFTHDNKWLDCAQQAEVIYRDKYVLKPGLKVPGYWNFSHGVLQDFLRNTDQKSKTALHLLSHTAAFTNDDLDASATEDSELSREVAYAIHSYLNAERAGAPPRQRLKLLIEQSLGHLDQWFVTKKAPYVRPFMVGISAHALISVYEKNIDSRIPARLTQAADWLWEHTWVESAQAFRYTDRLINPGDLDPAPDLNLLIAPLYAWLYQQSGEVRFRERGDKIFAGGVRSSWLQGAKQFNQNYRWSFDYVRWRN